MSLYNASTFWLISNNLIDFDGKNFVRLRKLVQLHLIKELFISSSLFNSSVRTGADRTVPVFSAQISSFSDNLGNVIQSGTIANNRLLTNIRRFLPHLCVTSTQYPLTPAQISIM